MLRSYFRLFFAFPRLVGVLAALGLSMGVRAQSAATNKPGAGLPPPAPLLPVWETSLQNFDQPIYEREVERLIVQFESSTGRSLRPGVKKKVGLKIYADSGAGLATPHALVHAVIAALERRGFSKPDIFLVGLNQLRLRITGFLPSLVTGETAYQGHPVFVLESGRFFDPVWFYDSPLPTRFDPILADKQIEGVNGESSVEEDRKSFLATPLFLEADFWINLPVYTDHPILGINGALVNATLWNASNTARFFRSPANAPAAVAEMSAIPELRATWAFTIASLERYQFIGGPYFNSLYTVSESRLWLSADPVAMDTLALQKINQWRKRTGFQPVGEEIRTLEFAETLAVGTSRSLSTRLVKLAE
ncbi:MAG: DUF362 domain-containing protein [Opitutaceae bacterium]|nr:DUF362 domain-containing protein [Opitutaceae bacterium]